MVKDELKIVSAFSISRDVYILVLSDSDDSLTTLCAVCCRNAEALAAQQVVYVLLIYALIYMCSLFAGE